MRAIENGRYLARAANTGISGFVDPYGRVLQKSALFEQAVLVAGSRGSSQDRTIYSRIGDLVAWLSLAFSVGRAAGVAARAGTMRRWRCGSREPRLAHDLREPEDTHWLCNWTISFAGTRIWRAAPATCGAIFDAARPDDELATHRRARRRPRLLEGSGGGAEAAAAPPPARGGSRPERARCSAASTTSPCSSSGPRPARRSPTISAAPSTSCRRRSTPARPRRCSAASTIARTRSSRFIRAPAAPSRRTGPRCCCACTCAGSSGAASSARSSTSSPATRPASRARR